MPNFEIYSRRGCHLCDELLEQLEPLCRGRAEIVVHDVDTNADWRAAYGDLVPVLHCDGKEVCRYTLDRQRIVEILGL